VNRRLNASAVVLAATAGLLAAALFFGGGSDDVDFLPVALASLFVGGGLLVATLAGLLPRPVLDGAGWAFVGLLGAFVVWSGLSVWWSLAPDLSWNLFNREVAYLAFVVAGVYAGALLSRHTIATGLAIGLGAVVAWALAGKVFPALVTDGERVSRLRAPVGYWNALALLCAAGTVLGLWLATDRTRGRGPRAAGAVLVYGSMVAVVLTYSRSGIVIMALAALAWVILGGTAFETIGILALAAAAAAPVLVCAFLSPGITDDGQPYSIRVDDGAVFAPVLLVAAVAVGVATYFLLDWSGPSPRARRAAVWATAGLLVLGACSVLAVSMVRAGGPGEWVDARWHDFTSATDVPSAASTRIGSLSSNHRWTWWNEAWSSFEDAPAKGRGAGTFPLVNVLERSKPIFVTQPHNLFLQALSDTGIAGFLLLVAAVVAAVLAAVRTVRRATGSERLAALALSIAAAAYLVQSLVDVDWDFVAVSGFLFFVVGALAARPAAAAKVAPAWALGVGAAACVAATSFLLPWLASEKTLDAYAAMDRRAYETAADEARSAHSLNSLAVDPLFALGEAETLRGNLDEAESWYARAVREQPKNPNTWFNLGDFELQAGNNRAACVFLTRATQLDPFDQTAAAEREQAC
jgi:O-antigen ligase/polysaccharide polymerase Wzy-like membrane protein/tetratricopeptide repeat protein